MPPLVDLHCPSSNRGNAQVLVVDDDICVGAAIQMLLNGEGYSAVYAPDSDSGRKFFESVKFDLAIVDIFMPGRSGIETIAGFRAQTQAVPIIAMSGFRFRSGFDRSLDFLAMAVAAGATASLRKPFTRDRLMSVFHESLNAVAGSTKQEGTARCS